MKRIVTLLMVVTVLLTFSVQALAADLEFAPSIEDKGAPELVGVTDENGKLIIGQITGSDGSILSGEEKECIIITPIREAQTSSDIAEETKAELLAVYAELKEKGIEAFPGLEKKNLAVRDLFDVSADCDNIDEFLPVDGNTLALTFDLKLGAKAYIEAMIYADGAWSKLPVVNNGDGTVTATFEDLGIVAFLTESTADSPDTGDHSGADLALWIGLMVGSAVLIIVLLVVVRRKGTDK